MLVYSNTTFQLGANTNILKLQIFYSGTFPHLNLSNVGLKCQPESIKGSSYFETTYVHINTNMKKYISNNF